MIDMKLTGPGWTLEITNQGMDKPPQVKLTVEDTDWLIRDPSDPRWTDFKERRNTLNGVLSAVCTDYGPFCKIQHVNQKQVQALYDSMPDN